MGNTGGWTLAMKKKATASGWTNAAVSVNNASDAFLARSEGIPAGLPEGVEDFNIGQTAVGAEYWTNHNLEGSLGELAARYEGVEKFLAQVAGEDTADVEAVTAYRHTARMLFSNVGQFVTIAKDTGVSISEVPAARITGYELKLADRMVTIAPNFVGNRLINPATVNTTLAAATPPSSKLALLFNSLVFRMNAQSGSALASPTDDLLMSDFGISWDRRQTATPVNRSDGTPDEPESDGGAPEGTVRLVFPNLAAAHEVFLTSNLAVSVAEKTPYKADFTFTGPDITGSTGPVQFLGIWEFPKLVVRSFSSPGSGPLAKVPVTIEMGILTPDTAPAGMTWAFASGQGYPMRTQVLNENTIVEASA